MRKMRKAALLALLGGTVLFSGCLQRALFDTAIYVGSEFVLDGGLLDIFPTGSAAAGG